MHFYKSASFQSSLDIMSVFMKHYPIQKKFNKKAFVWQEFSSFSATSLLAIIIKKTAYFPLQHISKHTVTLLDAKLILNYYIDIAPKRCITLQNVLCTCTFYVHCIQHYTLKKSC